MPATTNHDSGRNLNDLVPGVNFDDPQVEQQLA